MRRRSAFTLVELLVVIGIVALLIAMLLPSLARAWDASRLTRCASNLHQISLAMAAYACEWNKYPPNLLLQTPTNYWYDDDRAAAFLPAVRPAGSTRSGGGAYICPTDTPDAAYLSYAMNVWASSAVDPKVSALQPASGILWGPTVKRAAQMILVVEAYSGTGNAAAWFAAPTVGTLGATAGQRFGGAGGVSANGKRWGTLASELNFMRHRVPGTAGSGTQPRGRLNIAYADGHVAAKSDADLVLPSGTATGDSYWSPADAGTP